jgi:hypothetical protein
MVLVIAADTSTIGSVSADQVDRASTVMGPSDTVLVVCPYYPYKSGATAGLPGSAETRVGKPPVAPVNSEWTHHYCGFHCGMV